MQINVAQLLKEPVGAERSYKIDELAGENNDNRVAGEVNLTRTNRGILLTGTLDVDIKGICSRCLGEAYKQITFHMEDECFPLIDINSGVHRHPAPEDFIIDNSHILDLNEAIRQYIIMSTPTKLLCRPDCPGICHVCGHELAKGDCSHTNRSSDQRWNKLEQLKKESKV
jgi:uncharacterized protein